MSRFEYRRCQPSRWAPKHLSSKPAPRSYGIYNVIIKIEDAMMQSARTLMMYCYPRMKDRLRVCPQTSLCTRCSVCSHDINLYLNLLRVDPSLTLVGAPGRPLLGSPFRLIRFRRSFAGSMIGGIREKHRKMLDFRGKHNVVSDIEMINIQDVNEAYERLLKGDMKYRFVIDWTSLEK